MAQLIKSILLNFYQWKTINIIIEIQEQDNSMTQEVISRKEQALIYLRQNRILDLMENLCSAACYEQPKNIEMFLIDQLILKQTQGFKSRSYDQQEVTNTFILHDLDRKGTISKKKCIEALRCLCQNQNQYKEIKFSLIPEEVDQVSFISLYEKILIDHDPAFFTTEKGKRDSGVSTGSSSFGSTYVTQNGFDFIKQEKAIDYTLRDVVNGLATIGNQKHLLAPQCLYQLSKEIHSHYIKEDMEKRYIISLKQYLRLVNVSQIEPVSQKTLQAIKNISSNHLILQTQLFLQHLCSIKIASKLFDSQKKNGINLNELSFDLDDTETVFRVAQVVKQCCEEDINAFYFLSMYLQICVRKAAHLKSVTQVQKTLKSIIKQLRSRHPPNQKVLEDRYQLKVVKSFKKNIVYESFPVRQIAIKQRNKKLDQFIGKFAKAAIDNIQVLRSLTYAACLENRGVGFKINVKIDNIQNKMRVDRVKQKLLSKKFTKFPLKDGLHIQQFIVQQNKAYQEQLEYIFQNMEDNIDFTISDLLRGKCMFKDVEEINKAAQRIKEGAQKEGYQVLEVDNRLNKNTTDLVLKIRINGVIAEFQLAYIFNVVANEFNHCLFQLARSNFFNCFTMIANYNKKKTPFIYQMSKTLEAMKENLKNEEKNTEFKDEKYQKAEDYYERVRKWNLRCGNLNSVNFSNGNQKELNALYDSIQECKKREDQIDIFDYQIYYLTASYFKNRSKLKEADKMFEKWKESQKQYSKKDPHSKAILREMAQVKCQMGYLPQAKQIYEIRLADIKQNGATSQQLSAQLQQLGHIYYRQGYYEEAQRFYNQCLEIKIKQFGRGSYQTSGVLSQLGNLHRKKGNTQKSFECYDQAIEIRKKLKGPQSSQVMSTMNNKGMLYESIGEYEKALECYNMFLDSRKKINGKGSINTTSALDNIGSVLKKQGKYKEAMKVLVECLQIQQKIKGRDSIVIAKTLNKIGSVYYEEKDYQNAMKCFKQNQDITQKVKGAECIDMAETLRLIGNTLRKQGKLNDSMKQLKKALQIQETIKGVGNIDSADTLISIGDVYLAKQKIDEALQYFEKGLGIQQKVKGDAAIDKIQTLKKIGDIYISKKDFQKGREQYSEAYLISMRFSSCQAETKLIMNKIEDLNLVIQ